MEQPTTPPEVAPSGHKLWALTLGAIGVVYGDIGTSPLYAIHECFAGGHDLPVTPTNILGVLSLIVWSLILVVSVKYLAFVLRADNRGEGGILSLMALIHPGREPRFGGRWLLVLMGLFGAALLYGDGMITPAISVLSAVEGLNIATHVFEPYILPITILILVGLFAIQSRGTAGIGALFGPVMVAWFAVLIVLGVVGIASQPRVLLALSPHYGYEFFVEHRGRGFLVLGAVVLAVTGGEALYADMGHFGRRPIRRAWFALVLPALVLEYLGQGALLMTDPEAIRNPFFLLGPTWGRIPLVVLATAATVIASQAVISGAFSLTRQAVQLGYLPRMEIRHTSEDEIGQIYVPAINWGLMLATIGLVFGFKSSSALAAAYGVAVTATMAITTMLAYVVAREKWGWPRWVVAPFALVFLAIDLAFLSANAVKVAEGGWFPLAVGAGVFTLMSTWRRGRGILAKRLQAGGFPLDELLKDLARNPALVTRVSGTAVFLTGSSDGAPPIMLHHIKHNKVLHQQVVLLTIITRDMPHVSTADQLEVMPLEQGFYRVVGYTGFMDNPDVPAMLRRCKARGLDVPPMETTYYLGRETLIPTKEPGMAIWREHLFAFMSRNAARATAYFNIPANRVVELGVQVEI
jgi:KUP system potassium uptake protein